MAGKWFQIEDILLKSIEKWGYKKPDSFDPSYCIKTDLIFCQSPR